MSDFRNSFFRRLNTLSTPMIWLFSVILSMILTECIVISVAMLLGETKLRKYLLIGLVASLCVSSLVVAIIINLYRYMEEMLKNTQTQFRTMIEMVPIPMVMIDAQSSITFINPAFIKTFGYELNDVPTLMDWWAKAYPNPHYRRKVIENWLDILNQFKNTPDSLPSQEVNICCKEGSVKTILISVVPISDTPTTTYVVALYDITELRRSEIELAQNSRFSALIEAIPDAIFFKDGQGRWQITNEPAKKLFQLHNIAWQNKTDMELMELHPEFRATHQMCLTDDEAAWQAKQLTVFHETIVVEDGQNRIFEVRKVPLFAQNGQRQAIVIIKRDMTQQKQLEAQLSKLAQAVEQSPESIMITNLNAEIEYVNKAFTQISGYSFEESLGKKTSLLSSGKTPKETYINLWSALQQGQSWKGEFINRRKDGSEYIEFAVIAPLRQPDGVISHYVAINKDITQKKRLEKELEKYRYHLEELVTQRTIELMTAKAQAESANQAKSEFLANMSHEIRTPMNAILGFGEVLAGLITDKSQQYYLNAIKTSGKTLLHLINDILDLSKIEAKKLEIVYQPVAIKNLFDDIGLIFTHALAEKDVQFIANISASLPAYLMLDETRLRQVLLNLMSNAAKFTHQGAISLDVNCETTANPHEVALTISVTDTGIGITPDQVESIFAPFTQQRQQSSQYGGTGLGLTISKHLVEMMGGQITLTSTEGLGSRFSIQFPKIKIYKFCKDQSLQPQQPMQTQHFQPAKVLVVDDIESNRLLITSCLEDYPELTVIEADSGEKALEQIQHQKFDLILMDKRLPGIDGNLACQKIRTFPGYADIPIIMITASAVLLPQATEKFYNVQLNKPIRKHELLSTMQQFLPLHEPTTANLGLNTFSTQTAKDNQPAQTQHLAELIAVLSADYLMQITTFNQQGIIRIDNLIELAEELLQLAKQYHCQPLATWANTLKTQAELFDIKAVPKTLSSFADLITQLDSSHKAI